MPMRKDALPYMAGDAGLESAPPIEESYDHIIIATGSRPFVPPMDGFGKAGTARGLPITRRIARRP